MGCGLIKIERAEVSAVVVGGVPRVILGPGQTMRAFVPAYGISGDPEFVEIPFGRDVHVTALLAGKIGHPVCAAHEGGSAWVRRAPIGHVLHILCYVLDQCAVERLVIFGRRRT